MISLIVATKGKKKNEIIRFLNSICNSNYSLFEVIIVCQDELGYLDAITNLFSFNIKLVYSEPGLSKSRNIGLSIATGSIIAFPDDDCIYPDKLIENIFSYFQINQNLDIVTFDVYDLSNNYKLPFVNINKPRKLKTNDIFHGVSSITIFHRNKFEVSFDERFGLGSKFNSSEEFDYVLRLMLLGARLFYTNEFVVLHPDSSGFKSNDIKKRSKINGQGHGAYLRKHAKKIGLIHVVEHLIFRPFLGFLLNSSILKFNKANIYWSLLNARVKGFIKYKELKS